MADITIYSSPMCGFCYQAKRLLKSKGVSYNEIDIMMQPNRRGEMIQKAGGRTSVPQIFIDGHHVGGCDELHALDRAGKLDPMLGDAA